MSGKYNYPVPRRSSGTWLTVLEAADLLGLHSNTVKRIPPSELPYWRAGIGPGGRRRYRREDVLAYIERRMVR